jgi:20S proteasome subunit alpha 6
MLKNQYDNDITVWSPQGRIFQIEYALEAVKQGSACVGLKSETHAVLVALKRSSSELGSYQKKIFKIDEHIGIAISGLTGFNFLEKFHLTNAADARVLCKYMRNECLNYKFVFENPIQAAKLVTQVADSKTSSSSPSFIFFQNLKFIHSVTEDAPMVLVYLLLVMMYVVLQQTI